MSRTPKLFGSKSLTKIFSGNKNQSPSSEEKPEVAAKEVNGTEVKPPVDANAHAPNWEPLLEQPAHTPIRKLRVICIGAGFAGLTLAYKIQHEQKLEDEIDLTIYDRNTDVGGTWFENTYPGAACDIPSHAYCFPFEGNPDWSSFYVNQQEIHAYIKKTTDKYDLLKHAKLGTTVLETIWDEESGKWKVKVESNGEVKEDEADVLVNGAGFLNKWKWPEIKGLKDFKGKLVHSARWDNTYEWEGKKIAVIGNGASGIQCVATMQPKAKELVNYVRNPTWISINFIADKTPEGVNFKYSEDQKKIWKEDPKALYEYRRELEQAVNGFFFAMCKGHPAQAFFEQLCRDRMHASMLENPELEKKIMPAFKPGCRRITPGDGYLEALQQPNCRDEWTGIECITEKGIKTVDGKEEEFDLIVCATGFDCTWIPQWKLVGRNGATLEKQWANDPEAFFATQVENLPNYWMFNGPNCPISHGSVLTQMAWTCDYILRWVKKMNREDIKSIAVKKQSISDYNEYSQEFLKRTVWSDDCRTWYKNGKSQGRITGTYGGSMLHFKTALETVGGEHFDFTWRSKNSLRWLGNGMAEIEKAGAGDLAPYMDEY